ncbi:hypothetical protein R1flu_004222 [Riccia fluitans]|uniref:Uncharacterized protein n=1 Tax=Riccia fluitans TaxID=41844 RepID=A0ABD1YPY8_9MARC
MIWGQVHSYNPFCAATLNTCAIAYQFAPTCDLENIEEFRADVNFVGDCLTYRRTFQRFHSVGNFQIKQNMDGDNDVQDGVVVFDYTEKPPSWLINN